MAENRSPAQLPLILPHTTEAEKNRLWRFSALSAILHAALLAILLTWTSERLNKPPVPVITVDLSHLAPPRPRVAPTPAPSLPKPAPVRQLAPPPARRPIPVQISPPTRPQPPISAAIPPAATATSVAATTAASPGVPSAMPVRPAAGAAAVGVPTAPPPSATPAPVPRASRTADTSSVRAGYMHRCRSLIEHHKEYPVMARKGMIEGTVVIRGTLTRDGSLNQCGIIRTSGSGLLDNAALRAVRSVERFPPVPPELHGNELVFELPVSFRLSAK